MISRLLDWLFKLRVTIVMRSGQRYVFLADKITWTKNEEASGLRQIAWEGAVGAPSFIAITQVDLLYSRRVLRWTPITNS